MTWQVQDDKAGWGAVTKQGTSQTMEVPGVKGEARIEILKLVLLMISIYIYIHTWFEHGLATWQLPLQPYLDSL